jgi:Ca2+-binding EF-hand superfamily protein
MMLRFFPAVVLALSACAPAQAQNQDGARMIEQLEKADANGDGAISRPEFTAYRATQFSRLDRSQDGFLTDSDIPGFVQKRLPPEMSIDSLKAAFDANGDGKLSQAEFVNGPTAAFDRVDTNHDDTVTRQELDMARTVLANAR